jgi:periplasmic protein TonB
MPTAKSQTLSLGLHAVLVGLVLLLTSRAVQYPPSIARAPVTPLAAPHRLFVKRAEQHAGGSNQTLLPARHGTPPPTAHRTFIPPVSRPDPKLPIPITVAFESPTIEINVQSIGDPASLLPNGGLGIQGSNGIGDHGCCGGIGDQTSGKPGISSTAGIGHRVTPPQLIYKVEPEFSEAARKAKYQGVVVLAIEVDANGRPRNLRILEMLGLGLDEKAIEAVSQWRFRPGYQDGRPVVTTATVEVTFHLM